MNEWHLEKTLKRFVQDFKGFAKDGRFAKTHKAVVDLGVELLEVVLEELTNEELLELV